MKRISIKLNANYIIYGLILFLIACGKTSVKTNHNAAAEPAAADASAGTTTEAGVDVEFLRVGEDGGTADEPIMPSDTAGVNPQQPVAKVAPVRPSFSVPAGLGVRTFNEILLSMGAVTEVSPTTQAVANTNNENEATLPKDYSLTNFSDAVQGAIVKLATSYCSAYIASAKYTADVKASCGGFDPAAVASAAFAGSNKKCLATFIRDRLWGKDLALLPDPAQTETILTGLVDGLVAGNNAATNVLTRQVSTGVCIAVLASSPLLFKP